MHNDPATKNNGFLTDQQKIYEKMLMGDNGKGQASLHFDITKSNYSCSILSAH